MSFNIAIDGPAGAGKSTIAKKLSKDLGYIYVDTGAMYRAMALFMIRNNIEAGDEQQIIKACDEVDITIKHEDGSQQVFLNHENVNELIRTEAVGNMASAVAKIAQVRTKLVDLQRTLAKNNNVVMDGRDIGSFVLPDANIKIYLTASSIVRAKRRFDELCAKGIECELNEIKEDIEKRDYQDMNREISPLVQASDAILLDTSSMAIDQVVEAIKKRFEL
ncbi:MAG: (d)CMP kinase [Clostridiales bacterium]|nr:(d)CMP kinase [Clostridiales bacterium]